MFIVYLWGIEIYGYIWVWECLSWFIVYLWGIEIIKNISDSTSLILVYSLPMRNWNLSYRLESKEVSCKFIVYLWGIEIVAILAYQHQ